MLPGVAGFFPKAAGEGKVVSSLLLHHVFSFVVSGLCHVDVSAARARELLKRLRLI